MNKAKKMLSILLIVMMVCSVITPAAFAGESIDVHQWDVFELPFGCRCGDSAIWTVRCSNESVTDQAWDYDCGTVTCRALEVGRCLVNMYCDNCERKRSYNVNVLSNEEERQPIGLYLSESNLIMDEGDVYDLAAYWDAGSRTDIQWSVSDRSVCRIDAERGTCTVTARSEGNAVITVRDNVSGESDSCYVRVDGGVSSVNVVIDRNPSGAAYEKNENPSPLRCTARAYSNSGMEVTEGLTYQWYKGTRMSNCDTAIRGANSSNYYPDTDVTGTTYYCCIATYSVGSVHASAATTPVAVTVSGQSYGIYLNSGKTSMDAGSSTNLVAYLYDSNHNLIYGNYTITWEVNGASGATLDSYQTSTNKGSSVNTLYTKQSTNNGNVTVTVSVRIDGNRYTDYVNINTRGVQDNYSVVVNANNNVLSSGNSTLLTANVYHNGVLYSAVPTTVTWSLKNSGTWASINNGTTQTVNGTATNTFNALASPNGIYSVTAVASVVINGTVYTGTKDIQVQCTAAPVSNTKRIVMRVNDTTILNGASTIVNDVPPVIVNSRTMVPIRVVTEMLGGTADWNEATQTVSLNVKGRIVNMTIGREIAGYNCAPMIMNGRTYVPIRYVAEATGATVDWVESMQQIVITQQL